MGYIIRKLKVRGNKGVKEFNAMFDSGARHSAINKKDATFCDIVPLEKHKPFILPNGKKVYATGFCSFGTKIKDPKNFSCDIEDKLYVFPDLRFPKDYNMLIGNSTLQQFKIKMRFDEDKKKNRLDLSDCHRQLYTI